MMDIDPNEPLYCFCQQVSYGDMVGCDNDSVSLNIYFYSQIRLWKETKPSSLLTHIILPSVFLTLDSATRSGSIMAVSV